MKRQLLILAMMLGAAALPALAGQTGTLMVDTGTLRVAWPTGGQFWSSNQTSIVHMAGTLGESNRINDLTNRVTLLEDSRTSNSVFQSSNAVLQAQLAALQTATDALNTATGLLQAQIDSWTSSAGTNEPLWTAASNRVVYTNNASWTNWTANEAALVALPADVLKTLTNYVHVPSSSNWLDVDTAVRGLRGCVTNQGGAGSADASGWSGYAATQTVDMAGQSMTNMQTLELAKITAMPSDGAASNLIILGGAPFGGYSGPGGDIILEGSLGNPALGHGGYGWVVFSNYWADLNDGEITNVAGISFADGTRQTTAAGSGTGDMLANTYDPAAGARQVAFADDFAAVSNWGDHATAGYATGTPLYAYSETDPEWRAASNAVPWEALLPADTNGWTVSSHAGLATGTPVYAESDPRLTVWTNKLNGLALNGWTYDVGTPYAGIAFPVEDGVPVLFRQCTFTGTELDTLIVGNSGVTNHAVLVDCVLSNALGGDLVLVGSNAVVELIGCTLYSENITNALTGFTGYGSIYLRNCRLVWNCTNDWSGNTVFHCGKALIDNCTFTNIGTETGFTVCDSAAGVRKSVGFTGGYTFTEPLTRETGLDYVDIVNALMARVSTTGNGWGVTNLNGTNLVAGTVASNALSADTWAAIGTAAGSGYATNAGAAGEGYYAMSNGAWAAFTPGEGSGGGAGVQAGTNMLVTQATTNFAAHVDMSKIAANLLLPGSNTLIETSGTNVKVHARSTTNFFSVYQSSAITQSVQSASNTVVDFNVADYGSAYNLADDYAILDQGPVMFSSMIQVGTLTDGKRIIFSLWKNGVEYKRGCRVLGGGVDTIGSAAAWLVYNDSATNRWHIRVNHNLGSATNVIQGAEWTYFTGANLP